MAKINKTSFGNLYGTTGTTFPDNTTGEISESDMRTFGNHIQDSVMFIDNHLIDDDTFATATSSNVASAESTKAYVDAQVAGVGTLASGTYTPTLTNVSNLDSSTAYVCQYMRIGSVVTVSGRVDIDPTAANSLNLGISLPIASNFSSVNGEECGGTGANSGVTMELAAIYADSTNNRANLTKSTALTTTHSIFFVFTYRII